MIMANAVRSNILAPQVLYNSTLEYLYSLGDGITPGTAFDITHELQVSLGELRGEDIGEWLY